MHLMEDLRVMLYIVDYWKSRGFLNTGVESTKVCFDS